MYCGACEIHRAYKDSPGLRVRLAEKYGCRPADVMCEGCQVVHARGWNGDRAWGRNCRIRECLADNGRKFCYECPALDKCKVWNELAITYELVGMNLKANLLAIKAGRVKEWLAEQDRRWRCAQCGAPVAASSEVAACTRCRRPLTG